MYKCILFDMDGTLVNSYEGIYHSYQWAFEKSGHSFPGEGFVQKAIGLTVPQALERLGKFSEDEIAELTKDYREYYARQGKYEAFPYPGIETLLKKLKKAGCFLGTATLKRTDFAVEMLDTFRLLSFFDAVCGMDEKDTKTKADLIEEGRRLAGASRKETVLIGDSLSDAQGAGMAEVDFLAVTYGFGFQKGSLPEEVKMTADTVDAIEKVLKL